MAKARRTADYRNLVSEPLPVLLAFETPSSRPHTKVCLQAWCPYCRTWHIHGKFFGHHVAHCYSETPFSRCGYVLVDGETALKKLHKHRPAEREVR
jgi:hypothetical protein